MITLLIFLTRLVLRRLGLPAEARSNHPIVLGIVSALFAIIVGGNILIIRTVDGNLTDWLTGHVVSYSRLAIDATSKNVMSLAHYSDIGKTWEWRTRVSVDEREPSKWLGNYL